MFPTLPHFELSLFMHFNGTDICWRALTTGFPNRNHYKINCADFQTKIDLMHFPTEGFPNRNHYKIICTDFQTEIDLMYFPTEIELTHRFPNRNRRNGFHRLPNQNRDIQIFFLPKRRLGQIGPIGKFVVF